MTVSLPVKLAEIIISGVYFHKMVAEPKQLHR